MMNEKLPLWFENSYGEWRKIAECSYKDVGREIQKFIADCNSRKPVGTKPFVSYYTRSWQTPHNDMWNYDVGSHTEFFHWGVKAEIE